MQCGAAVSLGVQSQACLANVDADIDLSTTFFARMQKHLVV